MLASKVVGTDDTPVKVLDHRLPHTRKGRFWPYMGDREHPAVVYDYVDAGNVQGRRSSFPGTRAICKPTPMSLMTASS